MARPLLVRVGDLIRDPGSSRDIERRVDLGAVATSSASTIPGTDVEVDGVVTSMPGGVETIGTVGYDWYGECRRCLEDVTGHTVVEFREVGQRDPVDDEILPIEGDLLDLEPLARELILSSLPLAPLCRADCPGPEPERFPTVSETDLEVATEEESAPPTPDPRWGALDQLRFDD